VGTDGTFPVFHTLSRHGYLISPIDPGGKRRETRLQSVVVGSDVQSDKAEEAREEAAGRCSQASWARPR